MKKQLRSNSAEYRGMLLRRNALLVAEGKDPIPLPPSPETIKLHTSRPPLTRHPKYRSGGLRLIPKEHVTSLTSEIGVAQLPDSIAFYWHDMFTRRLPTNKAHFGVYVGVFIDGYLVGINGFAMADWMKGANYRAFLTFGEAVPCRPYRLNRLQLMLFTTQAFRRQLLSWHKTCVWPLNSMETTILSRSPAVNSMRGIMKLQTREQLDDGTYRLLYRSDWKDQSYKDCLKQWLTEEEKRGNLPWKSEQS